MPNEKKNLSKLLNKNKKKKTENTTSSKKEDEEAKPADSAIQDAPNAPDVAKSGAQAKKQDNDDSSDDEIQYKIDIENKIIEQ